MITAPQATRPVRRALEYHDFTAAIAEVDRLHRGSYRRAGNWELRQMCEHLALVMEGSLDGFAFAPWSWVWRRVIGPIAIRQVLWTSRMPSGLDCPDPSFAPRPEGDVAEAVERCRRALQRVAEHTGTFHDHPALGNVTPEQWKQIHLIHAAHHLSYLVPESKLPEDA